MKVTTEMGRRHVLDFGENDKVVLRGLRECAVTVEFPLDPANSLVLVHWTNTDGRWLGTLTISDLGRGYREGEERGLLGRGLLGNAL